MMLQKYKICPNCGEHNSPGLIECRVCETDLTGIPVVDDNLLAKEERDSGAANTGEAGGANAGEAGGANAGNAGEGSAASEKPGTQQKELFRFCDCGAQNPPQARKCQVCGEDISDIIPMEAGICWPRLFECKAIGDPFSATLKQPVTLIGREAEWKEYLSGKPYVSRQHARLTLEAGRLFIENLSKTNMTYVNNRLIEGSEPVELKAGDEVGLGGMVINGSRQEKAAYFRVCMWMAD